MPRATVPPETGQRWGLEGGHCPSQQELARVLQGLGDRFPGTSPRSRKPSPHVALAGPEGVVHWWGLGVQRGPLAVMCGPRRLALPTQRGFTKPAGGSGPEGSGRALTQGDPEAAAVSKAHETCPISHHSTVSPLTSDPGPPSQPRLPAPTPGRRSAGCAEGLCGCVHVLSTPGPQNLVLIPLQTSRTDHVRAQNPTQRGRIKARKCFLLGTTSSPSFVLVPVPNPVSTRRPRRPEGPVLGTDRRGSLF